MKIFRLLNHVARENTYLLVNDQAIIVVDPGSNTDKIKEKITAIDKPVAAILITHAHYDHIMGLDVIRDTFGQPRQTPGHSWGSVSLVFPDDELVITGDALFRETIGRTDLPTGNTVQLLNSIETELFSLPNHFTVYPGHGRETTIAHEKNFNPYFNTL